MLRAVLFDLDGTLLDHDAARDRALRSHLGAVLPALEAAHVDDLTAEWHRLEDLHFDAYAAGEISLGEQRRRRVHGLLEAAGAATVDDAGAEAWITAYRDHYEQAWHAFDDAAATLAALAAARPRLALGVVTNGDAPQQRRKLAALGLATLLPTVVASSEAGVAKPDPRIFLDACERLGLPPAEVAHVGDRLDVDARAATRAGLRGVWLDRARGGEAPDDVLTIGGLHELPAALGLGLA